MSIWEQGEKYRKDVYELPISTKFFSLCAFIIEADKFSHHHKADAD
jgi:hypothetical protein